MDGQLGGQPERFRFEANVLEAAASAILRRVATSGVQDVDQAAGEPATGRWREFVGG